MKQGVAKGVVSMESGMVWGWDDVISGGISLQVVELSEKDISVRKRIKNTVPVVLWLSDVCEILSH